MPPSPTMGPPLSWPTAWRSPVPTLMICDRGAVGFCTNSSRPFVAADHMLKASTARACCAGVMTLRSR